MCNANYKCVCLSVTDKVIKKYIGRGQKAFPCNIYLLMLMKNKIEKKGRMKVRNALSFCKSHKIQKVAFSFRKIILINKICPQPINDMSCTPLVK